MTFGSLTSSRDRRSRSAAGRNANKAIRPRINRSDFLGVNHGILTVNGPTTMVIVATTV